MEISYKLKGILGIEFVTVDYANGTISEGNCGKVSKKSLKDGLLLHDFQIVKCADNGVIIDTYTAYFCKYTDSYSLDKYLDGLTALLRSFLQASSHKKVYYIPYRNSLGSLYYVSNIALVSKIFTNNISREIFNQAKRGYTDAFIFVKTGNINSFETVLLDSGFEFFADFDYEKLDDMEGYLDSDILCFSTVYAVMRKRDRLDYVAMKHDDFSYTGQLKTLCASVKADVSMREVFSILSNGFFDEDEDEKVAADIVACLGVSKYYTIDGDYLYLYATDYEDIPLDAVEALRKYFWSLKKDNSEGGISFYRRKLFECLIYNIDSERLYNVILKKYRVTVASTSKGALKVSLFVKLNGFNFLPKKLDGYYGITVAHRWGSIEKILKSFSPVLQYSFDNNYVDVNDEDIYDVEKGFCDNEDGIFSFNYSVTVASEANEMFAKALISMVFGMLVPYLNADSNDDFDENDYLTLQYYEEELAKFREFASKRFSPAVQRRLLFDASIRNLLDCLGFRLNEDLKLFSPYYGTLDFIVRDDFYDKSCFVLDEILSGRTNLKIRDVNLRQFVECAKFPYHVKLMILANIYRENAMVLYKIAQDTTGTLEVDYDEAERLLGRYLANG